MYYSCGCQTHLYSRNESALIHRDCMSIMKVEWNKNSTKNTASATINSHVAKYVDKYDTSIVFRPTDQNELITLELFQINKKKQ